MFRSFRLFGGIGLAGVLVAAAIGAYAFTNTLSFNSNTTPVSLAVGGTTSDAYTVSGVSFAHSAFSNAWTSVAFHLDNAISNEATLALNLGNRQYSGTNATSGTADATCVATNPHSTDVTWTCYDSAGNSDFVTTFQVQVSQ